MDKRTQEPHILTVALVAVVQEGKLLLIEESKPQCRGKWFLPGGRSMDGESLVQTAVRETKEEAGVDVRLTGLLYVDQLTSLDEDGNRFRFVFAGSPTGGSLKNTEDEESIRAEWFRFPDVRALDLRSPFALRVLDLLEADAPTLPMASVHMLSETDRLLERP